MTGLPRAWVIADIDQLFATFDDGRTLHQGWSPQCEREPSGADDEWGVLKTTAVQAASFEPEHNKRLPGHLVPRPQIEVHSGDILITCAGPRARCGIACLVRSARPRLMMSGKMYRFRVPEAYVSPRYIEYYLQSHDARVAIDAMKTGGSDSGLNLTHDRFRRLPVPLAPLAEQERIVAAIEEQFSRLDAGEASLERARRRLGQLRDRGILALIEGKGTKVRLAQVADIRLGRQRSPKNHIGPNMVPYLRAANVTWDGLDLRDVKQMNFAPSEVSSYRLRRGDVLVAEASGSASEVGKPAIWDGSLPVCCFQNTLLRIRSEHLLPEYLHFVLLALARSGVFARASKGVGIHHLSKAGLADVMVEAPRVPTQRELVATISEQQGSYAALNSAIEDGLLRAKRLRSSILTAAFTGKLAPQDSTDEPASTLVEQIAAERASTNGFESIRRNRARAPREKVTV